MTVFGNHPDGIKKKGLIMVAAGSAAEAVKVCSENKTIYSYPESSWFIIPHTHTECDKPMIISEDK